MSFLLLEKYVMILLSNNYIEPRTYRTGRKRGLKEGPAVLGLTVNPKTVIKKGREKRFFIVE